MVQYVYKCVEVPTALITGKIGASHASAISAYQDIINKEAQGGWELLQADAITSVQKPGCFSALSGKKEEQTILKLLIFKRPA